MISGGFRRTSATGLRFDAPNGKKFLWQRKKSPTLVPQYVMAQFSHL
jgi:hypothetical protein